MKRLLLSLLRWSPIARPSTESNQPKNYFTQVYLENSWGGEVSRSGPGSEGAFAAQKVDLIRETMAYTGASSILDLGCGDFHWMKEIITATHRYHGVDVVNKLVKKNKKQFGGPNISFQCLDLSDPAEQRRLSLRQADLVVCLDVIGHLLNNEVNSLLRFIFYDIAAKFFLVSNRREAGSGDYLRREKTRLEGIDIEQHPLFIERHPKRVKQFPALYPNDVFDLYDLTNK